MHPVGEYLLVKADAWTNTRIIFPVQETLQPQLQRHTRQREHCSGDALKQKMLFLVAQALFLYKELHAPEIFIVGTCVDDRLVLVCTSGVPGVQEQVHELAGGNDDLHASLYLRSALEECLTSMECFTIPVFACFTAEPLAGVSCWTLPAPFGAGTCIHTLSTLAIYARPGTTPQSHLPLLDSSGCVFALEPVQLSPLFAHLYVKLFDHELVKHVYPAACSTAAVADLQRVIHGLTQSHNSWTINFLEFPSALPTLPPLQPLPASFLPGQVESGEVQGMAETVHASGELSTLAQVLTPALISYASTATVQEWRQQFDTSPLMLADMRQQHQRLLVRTYIEVKDEELKQAGVTGTALAEYKVAMLHALSQENTALTHMDGLVFDLLLLDVQPANVPALYHPAQFLSVARDGFTTMMLVMCWRQTLARLIAVGVETLETDALRQLISQYRHFRVGLIVQAPHVATVKSAFRMVQEQPCFFINVTETVMPCKPTLQQQKAESRNLFLSYFFEQALTQLSSLLGDNVSASLAGKYFGLQKPNSLNNLEKLFENLQGTARSIRSKIKGETTSSAAKRR